MDEPSHETVRLASVGDQDAQALVIEELENEVSASIRWHQSRGYFGASDIADAAQEAAICILRCTATYDQANGTFRAYAMRSVSNLLKRFGRHNLRFTDIDQQDDLTTTAPASNLLEVHDILESLQTVPRAILKDLFGIGRTAPFNVDQIASRRGLSPTEVRGIIDTAFSRLRKRSV